MASEPKSDAWIPACDLCGGLDYETASVSAAATVRRCRGCGLFSITHRDGTHIGTESGSRLPLDVALHAVGRLRGGYPRSMLVIGVPPPALMAAAENAAASVTALVDPGTAPIDGLVTHAWSLESSAFGPDSFDLILCLRGLDTFPSPSLLFERAARWLVAGGTLLVGSYNAEPMVAVLRRKRWLASRIGTSMHLLTPRVLGEYAQRFGFNVTGADSRSDAHDIAAVISGGERPGMLARIVAAPVAAMSSLLGKGTVVVAQMRKGALALRPISRAADESVETSSGLAPALYAGAKRERAAECV